MKIRVSFYFALAIVLSINFSCSSKEPCDNLQGRIHEDLRAMYPYSLEVEGLVFENDNGDELIFDLDYKVEEIVTINSNGEYPYEAQQLKIQLYNAQLDIHLNTTMYGGYATYMCPEVAIPGGFVSISGPLGPSVPVSSSEQSQNLIIVQVEDDELIVEESDLDFFSWGDQVYQNVYKGNGDFDIYFNFDIGIIGFFDPLSNQNYYHKETIR